MDRSRMMFMAKAKSKQRGEVYIYDAIGKSYFDDGVSAKSFNEAMKALGDPTDIDFFVNSPGGSVFEGLAIYNQIKRHPAKNKVMHVDGIAASIASIIICAGTEIRIAANGMVMIHDPWGMAVGSAKDMRKQAESLDQVRAVLLDTYEARTTSTRADIDKWMDEETWMDADTAIKRGFAQKKTDDKALEASFPMLEKFAKVPPHLLDRSRNMTAKAAHMQMRVAKMNRGASPVVKA